MADIDRQGSEASAKVAGIESVTTGPLTREERAELRAELLAAGAELPANRGEGRLLAAWRRLRIVDAAAANDPREDRRGEVMREAWRLSRALGVRAEAPLAVRAGAMEIGTLVVYDGAEPPEVDAVLAAAVRAVQAYDALDGAEAPCAHPPPCSCTLGGQAARAVAAAARVRGEVVRPALWRARDRAVLSLDAARAEGDPDRVAAAEVDLERAERAMHTRDAWREELDRARARITLDPKSDRGARRMRALLIVERVTGIPLPRLRRAM